MESLNETGMERAFIAVDFEEEVLKEIARIQEVLKNLKFTGKFTELENMHLTLKFLGEIGEEKLNLIKERLKEVKIKSFSAKLSDVGLFNYKGKPRIIWVKIGGEGIFLLQKRIDEEMEKAGFKREERFMSHVTIARIKYVKDVKKFKEYVQRISAKKIEFEIDRFKLKSSELKPIGPVYRDVGVYFCNTSES